MKRRAPVPRTMRPRARSSCAARGSASREPGEKDWLLQKVQPPMPLLPSRLGQVKPGVERDLVHLLAMARQHGATEGVDALRKNTHLTGLSVDPRAQQDRRVDRDEQAERGHPQQAGSDDALQV